MLEDKIMNNSYDSVEYGTEGLKSSPIQISPLISDRYEESTTEDISDIFIRKKINEELMTIFEESEYFKKYGNDCKKLEKGDISDIYYTFKRKLNEIDNYNIVEIFCGIAEFFDLNYKTLYNDVISLEDKAMILESLEQSYGLQKKYMKSKKLF